MFCIKSESGLFWNLVINATFEPKFSEWPRRYRTLPETCSYSPYHSQRLSDVKWLLQNLCNCF